MVLNTGSIAWNKAFGARFWAHQGKEGDQEQSAWVYQGQIMLDQPDCPL